MFSILENHKKSFRALAYVIERKLLEMQMAIIAHRHPMRFVHIKYVPSFKEDDTKQIEATINKMYDLLENFCSAYDIPPEELDLKK